MSLRQVRLVPAGVALPALLGANSKTFAFASTLSLYFFDSTSFELLKLLPAHLDRIVGFCWNPHSGRENSVVTCGSNGEILFWDTSHELAVCSSSIPRDAGKVIQVSWDPFSDHYVAVATTTGAILLVSELNGSFKSLYSGKTSFRLFRWSPTCGETLVTGNEDGSLLLLLTDHFTNPKPSCRHITLSPSKKAEGTPVCDLQWDVLSSTYLLVGHRNGTIFLWDTENGTVMREFDRQPAGVTALCWLPLEPGTFLSTNNRSGVASIWNVSQSYVLFPSSFLTLCSRPMGHSPLGNHGIEAICPIPESRRALCAHSDGSVSVVDLQQRLGVWSTTPGHAGTIFCVEFNPKDGNVLATCGLDGQCKLWSVETMECLEDFSTSEYGVAYSCSWQIHSEKGLLAVGYESGRICCYNTERGSLESTGMIHEKGVMRVRWSSSSPSYMASASPDATVAVGGEDCTVFVRIHHPSEVFGCSWSPLDVSLLASASRDCIIRFWRIDFSKCVPGSKEVLRTPELILRGHRERVFNVEWSPHSPGIVASASDDCTVNVSNVSIKSFQALVGHTQPTRGLCWSPEVPHWLLTGSWDSTIRLWDVRRAVTLRVLSHHCGDIYGLNIHPSRPFLLATSSRDSSLRLWRLIDHSSSGVHASEWRCLLCDGSVDTFATSFGKSASRKDSVGRALQLGRITQRALNQVAAVLREPPASVNPVTGGVLLPWKLTREIICNFTANPAVKNFLRMIEAIMGFKAKVEVEPSQRPLSFAAKMFPPISHTANVVQETQKHADVLATIKGIQAMGLPVKREERLGMAAMEYVMVGDFANACEAYIELKQWDMAMSLAPAVSERYWKEVCERYSTACRENLVAAGSTTETIRTVLQAVDSPDLPAYLISLHKPWDACSSCAVLRNSSFPPRDSPEVVPPPTVVRDNEFTELRQKMTVARASSLVSVKSDSVSACCVFLASNDLNEAMNVLLRGEEIELAYVLCSYCWDLLGDGFKLLAMKAVLQRLVMCGLYYCAVPIAKQLDTLSGADGLHTGLLSVQFANGVKRGCEEEDSNPVVSVGSSEASVFPGLLCWAGERAMFKFLAGCGLVDQSDNADQAKAIVVEHKLPSSFRDAPREPLGPGSLEAAGKACLHFALGTMLEQAVEVVVETVLEELHRPVWDCCSIIEALAPLKAVELSLVSLQWRIPALSIISFIAGFQALWKGFTSVAVGFFRNTRVLTREGDTRLPERCTRIMELLEVQVEGMVNPEQALRRLKRVELPVEESALGRQMDVLRQCLEYRVKRGAQEGDLPFSRRLHPSGSSLPRRLDKVTSKITGKRVHEDWLSLEDGKSIVTVEEVQMWTRCSPFSPLNSGKKIRFF